VTCRASDSAGNVATGSFRVAVADTTPPRLTLPGPLTVAATSASGANVTYSASASDVVAGPRTPACTPASGSLFRVGETTVNCQVNDGNGNTATGSFVVTVTRETPPPPPPATRGAMYGYGHVGPKRGATEFNFHVKETSRGQDRGWVMLQVRDGWRVSTFVSVQVRTVVFSNSQESRAALDRAFHRAPEKGPDTVVFTGTGWWKGRRGYTFEAKAEDRGEPGRGKDTLTVVVRDARGTVVHSVTGVLTSGNIQSVAVR
jgi:hypothetical protein